jgi:hypothetical protein
MNDFTKEELQKIQDALIFIGTIEKNLDFYLSEKIQSMIENFCEHNIIGEMTGTTTFPYCNKCHKAIFIESEPGHDNQ